MQFGGAAQWVIHYKSPRSISLHPRLYATSQTSVRGPRKDVSSTFTAFMTGDLSTQPRLNCSLRKKLYDKFATSPWCSAIGVYENPYARTSHEMIQAATVYNTNGVRLGDVVHVIDSLTKQAVTMGQRPALHEWGTKSEGRWMCAIGWRKDGS